MAEPPTSEQPMGTGRLEAFSDGVIAIIITIMVLELQVPRGADAVTLLAQWPVFLSYALSYLVVAIYWINHHRLFHIVPRVNYTVAALYFLPDTLIDEIRR